MENRILTDSGMYYISQQIVSTGLISAVSLGTTIAGAYQGNYYKSVSAISGRCLRTIITTYEDKNCTAVVGTYYRYTKW